jgi:hypothetical protein
MEVTSELLKLQISFQWQPLINDTIIDTIRQWATDSQADRPKIIFLGRPKHLCKRIFFSLNECLHNV